MASMRQLAEVIAANETAAAELERFEEQAAESAALAIRERLGDQYTDEYESVIVDAVAEAVDEDRALLQQTHDDIVRILSSVAAAADTL